MNIDCKSEIRRLFASGSINKWGKDYLDRVCSIGMTDSLWGELVHDIILSSELGVSSEEDFKVFFYIDHFVEELVEEILSVKLSESEEDDLKRYMFSIRKKLRYTNLLDYRVAILSWIKKSRKKVKTAYHLMSSRVRNTGYKENLLRKYNLNEWGVLASMIERGINYGMTKEEALIEAGNQISDNIEKLDFLAWYNFRVGKNTQLYNLNDVIKDMSRKRIAMKNNLTKNASIFEDDAKYYIPKRREDASAISTINNGYLPSHKNQRAEDIGVVRSKMISRTFAIDKLLEKYKDVLSEDQVEEIEDILHKLRKTVRKLKLASMLQDTFHKTANRLVKKGFSEGGSLLISIASPEGLRKEAISESDSIDLEKLLAELYGIADILKRRDIVRMISSVDLRLHSMNLSGFVPELTDAQSKLIDAFGYASNKVQDVIPKLRSGITQGGGVSIDAESPKPVAPKPVAPKPVAPKPVAPKPVAPKPVAPKPVAPKPASESTKKQIDDLSKAITLPIE